MSVFDEIRARADLLEEVRRVSRKVVRRGRSWYALCPFHNEKTPSLSVDPVKGLWHCFGCERGGDVIGFVAEAEHLDYVEAAKLLAERLGIPWKSSARSGGELDRMRKAMARAQQVFSEELRGTSHGVKVRQYLRSRGIDEKLAAEFGLGTTPQGLDSLYQRLSSEGFREEELRKAGLISVSERGPIDFFRGRLTIPIHDHLGRLVAFSGRALAEGQEPKYLNSPETPLFRKRRTLYNLYRARNAIAREGAIVVEGYMDVIALHQAGVENVVATSGTALSVEHARQLGRLTDRIYLCFDGDPAGVKAAFRAALRFLEADLVPRIVLLPEGMDPDDLVRSQGREGFMRKLDNSVGPASLVARLAGQQSEDPTARRMALFELGREMVQATSHPVIRDGLIGEMASLLKLSPEELRQSYLSPSQSRGGAARPAGLVRLAGHARFSPERQQELESELIALLMLAGQELGEIPRDVLELVEAIALSPQAEEALKLALAGEGELVGFLSSQPSEFKKRLSRRYHLFLERLEASPRLGVEGNGEEGTKGWERMLHRSLLLAAYKLYRFHLDRKINELREEISRLLSGTDREEGLEAIRRKQRLEQLKREIEGEIRRLISRPEEED